MNSPQLSEYLKQFVNDRRLALINEKIEFRTTYISILLEDVYQSRNISAVMRSAECLGVQNFYIIENQNRYELNPYVSRGAAQWLSLKRFNETKNNTKSAITYLKNKGYRIIVTSPNVNGYTPESFDVEKGKFALVLGTEGTGISTEMLEYADEFIRIPMVGFTESFNLSASASILLYTLLNKIKQSNVSWKLNTEEYETIKTEWLKAAIPRSDKIVENYLKSLNSQC